MELFDDLHRHGIQTIGSLVLGFDFHTRESLKADIDRFVALKPGAYQISPLTPCPGTALYERMSQEGRLYDSYRWEDFHLWKDDVFQLKNFERGELKEFYDYAHTRLRDENGPQALQVMESSLDSYRLLKERSGSTTDEYRAFQAKQERATASGVFTLLRAIQSQHPSEKVRSRAKMLERRYQDEIGPAPLTYRVASRFLAGKIKKSAQRPQPPPFSDPPPRWSYYHTFDDQVWVVKGRQAGKPKPYAEPRSLAASAARAVMGEA